MFQKTRAFQWKVLLIGGSSATGKTVVTRALAEYFQVSTLLVDDLRLSLQQLTLPSQQPALHKLLTLQDTVHLSAGQICTDWIRIGKAIGPAIKIVMAHHTVVTGVGAIIIEGDGILPELAAQHDFRELKFFWGLQTTHEIQSVFLYEPDESILLKNMQDRERGFNDLALVEQQKWARASWLYGKWLRSEAMIHQLPVITVQPYNSLLDRILVALQ